MPCEDQIAYILAMQTLLSTPGVLLIYFNDGRGPSDFLGLKFLAKVIFFGL